MTLEVNGREMVYVLGTRDLSIATDYSIISPESPIGAAINGAHAGDTVTYTAPNGREISVTIKEPSRSPDIRVTKTTARSSIAFVR